MGRRSPGRGPIRITILALVFTGYAVLCFAGNFTLTWNPNPETDLQGYYLYCKPRSSVIADATDATRVDIPLDLDGFDPREPAYKFMGLQDGVPYYFAVSAYNQSGESAFAGEIQGLNPAAPTAPTTPAPTSGSGSGGGCFIGVLR